MIQLTLNCHVQKREIPALLEELLRREAISAEQYTAVKEDNNIVLLTAFEVNTGSYCQRFIRIDRVRRGQYE